MAAGAVAGATSEPNSVTSEDEIMEEKSGGDRPEMGMQHAPASKQPMNGSKSGEHCHSM